MRRPAPDRWRRRRKFVKSFVKWPPRPRRARTQPPPARPRRRHAPPGAPCGLDAACARRPQRELHALVGHLPLERRLVDSRAVACVARHLLRAVLLGVFVPESPSPAAPCTVLPSRSPSIAGPLSSEWARYMRNACSIRYGHCPVVSRAGLLGCEDQGRWID